MADIPIAAVLAGSLGGLLLVLIAFGVCICCVVLFQKRKNVTGNTRTAATLARALAPRPCVPHNITVVSPGGPAATVPCPLCPPAATCARCAPRPACMPSPAMMVPPVTACMASPAIMPPATAIPLGPPRMLTSLSAPPPPVMNVAVQPPASSAVPYMAAPRTSYVTVGNCPPYTGPPATTTAGGTLLLAYNIGDLPGYPPPRAPPGHVTVPMVRE